MTGKLTALEKVLAVLNTFKADNRGISTTELSKSLGIHKSSISRIANTLTEQGYLLRNPQTNKYHLGRRIISLGLSVTKNLNQNIIDIARPYLDELSDSLSAAITLAILYGNDVIVAYVADNPGLMGVTTKLGKIHPLNTASSKAIFSFLSPQRIEEALNRGLTKFTKNTITDPEELRENFRKTREQGYALDNEELRLGFNAVSVPIFDSSEKPVAAISVIGLTRRFEYGRDISLLTRLQETSEKISSTIFQM